MKFEFEKGIRVTALDIRWDILWVMEEDGIPVNELNDVNEALTVAAVRALETNNPKAWFIVSEAFADYGAADSEPIWQFRDLWYKAYGEDI